ncbi:hypothetical protein NM208_g5903 [Fusarium decemcellulare]|uniref:Uncharacterized protein n=1 Tax=Fusarium decemcellulare TaxID=57161 RepID=A0ACC1SFA9_9HYPO|nr:hypothetical protein NM208_g5903 [Fusarium decemcellulare]
MCESSAGDTKNSHNALGYEAEAKTRHKADIVDDLEAEVSKFLALPLDEQTAGAGKCNRTVHPDELTLSDGTVFDIGNAQQADIDQLMDIIINKADASIEDVPEPLRYIANTE